MTNAFEHTNEIYEDRRKNNVRRKLSLASFTLNGKFAASFIKSERALSREAGNKSSGEPSV